MTALFEFFMAQWSNADLAPFASMRVRRDIKDFARDQRESDVRLSSGAPSALVRLLQQSAWVPN
ncbi:MAG: hypothetical protein AABZ44_06630, partial [Elusimicrobiota bacterium]